MRFSTIALVCLALFLSLAACSKSGDKKLKLAFVTNNASDFWTIARKGVEQAGRELPNVEAEFKTKAEEQAAYSSAVAAAETDSSDVTVLVELEPDHLVRRAA